MIRPIDIKLNAAHPELPLVEATTFTGAPSSVFIRGVPKSVGNWSITAVNVAVTYPDNSTTTRAAVESAEGVWVATLPATATSGRTANGFRVMADGIDENGEAVTGYILGVADFAVASLDVTPAPEPGETSYRMLYFDEVPSALHKGDVAKVDGVLKLYNGTEWEPFAAKSNVYNVLSYGAKADGETDDSAAIQSAIDAAASNGGGLVYIPAGSYKTSGVMIVNDNIHIRGAGMGATKLLCDYDIVRISESPQNPQSPQANHSLEAAFIFGVEFNNAGGSTVVAIENCSICDVEIDGCETFEGSYVGGDYKKIGGVFVYGCKNFEAARLYIHDCYSYGVGFAGTNFANRTIQSVRNCRIERVARDGIDNKAGIGVFNCDGNYVKQAGYTMNANLPQCGFDIGAYDISASDNYSEGCPVGMRVCYRDVTLGLEVGRVKITNCTSRGSTKYGFAIRGYGRPTLVNCKSSGSGEAGFAVIAKYATLVGCVSEGDGVGVLANYDSDASPSVPSSAEVLGCIVRGSDQCVQIREGCSFRATSCSFEATASDKMCANLFSGAEVYFLGSTLSTGFIKVRGSNLGLVCFGCEFENFGNRNIIVKNNPIEPVSFSACEMICCSRSASSRWADPTSGSDILSALKDVNVDLVLGKADKVTGATAGDIACLDASGNLTDSGVKPSDFQSALTAQQLANIAAVPNKADASAIPYALVTKTITNGAVSLDNRASNAVTISATLSPNTLTVNFPTATSGKVRDFAMRLNIAAGVTAPEIAWPQGVTLENDGGEVPEIADGGTDGSSTILYFSETENDGTTAKFLVKGETLTAIAQA